MGNVIRRETGFEIEDIDKAQAGADLIDKILKMKQRTRVKRIIEQPPNLKSENIDDEIMESKAKQIEQYYDSENMEEEIIETKVRQRRPPPVEEEIPRKSKRMFMGDFVSKKKDDFTKMRESELYKEDILPLYI